MKTNIIDDRLEKVDYNLVAAYEKNNNITPPLAVMNERYKAMVDPYAEAEKWMKRCLCVGLSGLAWFLILLGFGTLCGGLVIAVTLLPTAIYYYQFVEPKLRRNKARLHMYVSTFENFKADVQALNPFGGTIKYTEASVRAQLVECALRVLAAEIEYNGTRMYEKSDLRRVLFYGSFLQGARDTFESTKAMAKMFGLEFDTAKLFADAKKCGEEIVRFNQETMERRNREISSKK